jgi:hypothetical protein
MSFILDIPVTPDRPIDAERVIVHNGAHEEHPADFQRGGEVGIKPGEVNMAEEKEE